MQLRSVPLSPDPLPPGRDGNNFLKPVSLIGPWNAWTYCVPMTIPALLLLFLHQESRREKQPGTRKYFFDQPALLEVVPGPSSVISDPCSPVHQALYPHYYSPVCLAGVSQPSIPSDLSPPSHTWKHPAYTPISQSPSSLSTANSSHL